MKNVDTVKTALPFTNSELALKLAAQGWRIFPCREGENAKAPYTKGGFKDASDHVDQIRQWWQRWPNALIGFPPGPNGLLVIDQDVKAGTDGVNAWRDLSGAWQDAVRTLTPSGGCHDWFLAPKRTIGNGRGKLPKGIDVRCDGGYVCLGTLADGSCYAPDGEPDLYEILMSVEDAESWFWPMPAELEAMLPEENERQTSKSSHRDPLRITYSKGYEPVTLARLCACSESIRDWEAPRDAGRTNSDDAFDWLTKAIVGMCQALEKDADAFGDDETRNLAELALKADHAFMTHYDERGPGKLGYDIARAIEWAAGEGIRSSVAALAGFDALAQTFRETGHTRAESGGERQGEEGRAEGEAAGFHELLEALADARPDELTLDLKLRELAAMTGAPGLAALRKAYAGIRRMRAKEARSSAIKWPDEMPLTGAPRTNSLVNVRAWLEASKEDIWFDEWSETVKLGNRPFDDHELRRIMHEMHADKLFADRTVKPAIDAFAFERRAHPVKDWLEDAAEAWDGRERLGHWLEDYCGAPDNEHWQAVARLTLVAVVGRVFCPGVKWDQVLTFIGPEGFDKSTLCRVLAIRPEWHLEGFQLKWSMKEIIEHTTGILIAEYAEFSGHKMADQDMLKDAVTRTADKARKAYHQYETHKPRSFIIIGNSNEDAPLQGTTGNRRYWPLKLAGPIDTKGLKAELVQIYGEAVHAWQAGETAYRREGILLPQAHWDYFGTLQEETRAKISMEERLEDVMQAFGEGHIAAMTLFDLFDVRTQDRYIGRDIGRIMERLGWEKKRTRFGKDAHPRAYFIKGARHENTAIVCAEGLNGKGLHAKKVR
jgi:hypothetical protein